MILNLEIKPEYLFYPQSVPAGTSRQAWLYKADCIPLHPKILSDERFFSDAFVHQIRKATPEMVRTDLDTIEKKLEMRPYELIGDALVSSHDESERLEFNSVRPTRLGPKTISLNYGVNCWLMIDAETRSSEEQLSLESYLFRTRHNKELHPIAKACVVNPRDKVFERKIKTWKTKDTDGEGGFSLRVYFRAFAMAYTNTALRELGLIK